MRDRKPTACPNCLTTLTVESIDDLGRCKSCNRRIPTLEILDKDAEIASLRATVEKAYDALYEIKREAIRPGGSLYAMLPGAILDKMQAFFDSPILPPESQPPATEAK